MTADELAEQMVDEQMGRADLEVNPVGVLAWTVTLVLWAAAPPLLVTLWRVAW